MEAALSAFPSIETVKICDLAPLRLEINATVLPSGETAGEESATPNTEGVNWRIASVLFNSASSKLVAAWFFSKSYVAQNIIIQIDFEFL